MQTPSVQVTASNVVHVDFRRAELASMELFENDVPVFVVWRDCNGKIRETVTTTRNKNQSNRGGWEFCSPENEPQDIWFVEEENLLSIQWLI